MKWSHARIPGAAAAAVLAVLTLVVFYVLQDYGPESAIRRFMSAVAANDDAGAQLVVDAKLSDQSVQNLAGFVKTYLNRGVQPQIARMDRQGDRDQVVVVYHLANGDTLAIVWIVDKVGRLWRINTRLTWDALRKSLPGYS